MKLYRNKLFPRTAIFLQFANLTMHDCFSNRDLVPLHISILLPLYCAHRVQKIDMAGPDRLLALLSLAGGEGRGSA
jgi:hypothetical protein